MSNNITIEHNPDAARLSELGVDKWPTWAKEGPLFPFLIIQMLQPTLKNRRPGMTAVLWGWL